MPGMQAAFVEVGLERAAFLHASDIVRTTGRQSNNGVARVARDDHSASMAPAGEAKGWSSPVLLSETAENGPLPPPPISELVHEGQEIVVQVVKDPIGTKGARLTTHLSVPSRYLVLLPHAKMIGVSVRIEDEGERTRLKEIMPALSGDSTLGYIVRTNAEGQTREALAEDDRVPGKLWRSCRKASAERGSASGSTKSCVCRCAPARPHAR
jgi:ribonuclease G